jgi:23S rRNA (adenine2030-N6)-methyltransferase
MRRVSSRYRPESGPDYSHRFHAGNVGDVWKHCILVEVLRRAAADGRVIYVESHAGEGEYALGPTGEWTEGIGRLWRSDGSPLDATVGGDAADDRYLALVRTLGAHAARPERYPGSPLLARAVLGPHATLLLWERDADAAARLTAALGAGAGVACGDGLAGLTDALRGAEAGGDRVVALVDPPFTQKPDWTAIPDAVIGAAAGTHAATILLWYPVKSLTRPNAMIARFRAAGVSATVAELTTTPLEHQRQRLNGSGLVLVRPPAGAVARIAAAAPALGERCATRPGVWSLRLASW